MKKLILILVAIICLVIGYALGIFFPLTLSSPDQTEHSFNLSTTKYEGIQGDSLLKVNLKMDNGQPLQNVEVDLAETPGQPPIGGVALSDENGQAVFNVQPGNYFIFFNDVNFPKNVENPGSTPVEVKKDGINEVEILLTVK